ncbi:5'-3' exoribonuclease [Trifolium repens]|nr:5'-3' exoribonuclease [Trifolium repens]
MKAGEFDEKGDTSVAKLPFQFLNIWTLREYLEYEMRIPNPSFKTNFERILVENDFLPHMPTLDIREILTESNWSFKYTGVVVYDTYGIMEGFSKLGGYLTNGSKLNLSRVEHFIQAFGAHEDKILQKRAQLHQVQDNEDESKTKLKGMLWDKSDVFNSKGAHEDKPEEKQQNAPFLQTLAVEDLKPEPVLGHEDSGSRYGENQRSPDAHEDQNATTSGQHAGGGAGVDEECQICGKEFIKIFKFGLFPDCAHLFCLPCIMHWRQNGIGSWNNLKSKFCPTPCADDEYMYDSDDYMYDDDSQPDSYS